MTSISIPGGTLTANDRVFDYARKMTYLAVTRNVGFQQFLVLGTGMGMMSRSLEGACIWYYGNSSYEIISVDNVHYDDAVSPVSLSRNRFYRINAEICPLEFAARYIILYDLFAGGVQMFYTADLLEWVMSNPVAYFNVIELDDLRTIHDTAKQLNKVCTKWQVNGNIVVEVRNE